MNTTLRSIKLFRKILESEKCTSDFQDFIPWVLIERLKNTQVLSFWYCTCTSMYTVNTSFEHKVICPSVYEIYIYIHIYF